MARRRHLPLLLLLFSAASVAFSPPSSMHRMIQRSPFAGILLDESGEKKELERWRRESSSPSTYMLGWLHRQLERWRRRNRPKRIILVRHGESVGNVNKSAYCSTPDSRIGLTRKGLQQGAVCGLQMRELVGNETTRFYYSPYVRARQTLLAILQAFEGKRVEIASEPRLREQDFGNFQEENEMAAAWKERSEFGRFFYRFPSGEAGTDVFDRTSDFLSTLFADFDQKKNRAENIVLVTHGLLMRIFSMCYFRWTVKEFEQVWNPSNCEIWVLEKVPSTGEYELAGRYCQTDDGRFVDVKYGANQDEAMPAHLKRPLEARSIVPGPDCLSDEALAQVEHSITADALGVRLRDLPKSIQTW